MKTIKLASTAIGFLISMLFVSHDTVYGQCYTNGSGTYLSGEAYSHTNEFAGSQFLIDSWLEGDVTLETGDVIKKQLIRYNIYTDDLVWFETNNNTFVKLDKGLITGFSININNNDSTIHFVKLNIKEEKGGANKSVFLQTLLEGDISVFVHRRVVQTGRTESVFIAGRAHQRLLILPSNSYYISFPGGPLLSIYLNKKSLIGTVISEYPQIDKRNLRRMLKRIKSEQDLIDAILAVENFVMNHN